MYQISAVIFLFLFDIASANVSAIFIFGDSLVDVGNNNYINTLAKARFPNGIDFCNNAFSGTARFTNGRTVTDIIGKFCCFCLPCASSQFFLPV